MQKKLSEIALQNERSEFTGNLKVMNCRKAERFSNLRLDGELNEKRSRRLDDHLQKCTGCNHRFALLTALSAEMEIAAAERVELTEKSALDEMWNNISAKAEKHLEENKSNQKIGFSSNRFQETALAAAAVMAGLIIGAWFFYDGYGSPEREISDQTHVEGEKAVCGQEAELVAEAFENGSRNDFFGVFQINKPF